jgi:MinD superfamily P-loop ATPase
MAPPVIKKVKELAINKGVVIVDVPPGTSCPVVEAIRGSDYCLLVTEPTPFGLNDLALAVETVRALDIPCGIVLNRTGVGNGNIEEYCQEENIPILLKIPLDTEIASLYSKGITLAEGMPKWQEDFRHLFDKIKELCSERSIDNKR